MLHTKAQGHWSFGSGEDFWRVFTTYGRGGHLGHVTQTPWTNFRSPIPLRLHMKLASTGPSGFGENLWKWWTDGQQRRDDRACLYYKLTNEPKGSGELKIVPYQENRDLRFVQSVYLQTCMLSLLTGSEIRFFAFSFLSVSYILWERTKVLGRRGGGGSEGSPEPLRFIHMKSTFFTWAGSIIEAARDKTNKMTFAPSKDSDQTGHPDQSSLSAGRKIGSSAIQWAHCKDSDQTGQMPRLNWIFAGHTDHFVGFVVRRLNYCPIQTNLF